MATEPTKAELAKKAKADKAKADLAERAQTEGMPTQGGVVVKAGWFIQTLDNLAYEGLTCGVPFKYGMAFLMESEENAAKVRQLQGDFEGYTITYLEGEALQKLREKGPAEALAFSKGVFDLA